MSKILAAQLENEKTTKRMFKTHTNEDIGKAHAQNYHIAVDVL